MRDVNQTIEAMGPLSGLDHACLIEGFAAGNFAAAYETEDFEVAQQTINGANGFYRIGHLLGFFSSFEVYEIPNRWASEVEHYRAVVRKLNLNLAID